MCTRLLALLKPYMTKASAATAAAGNSSRRRARRHPRAVGGNPPRVVQVVFDDDANEGGAQEGQGETPFEWWTYWTDETWENDLIIKWKNR